MMQTMMQASTIAGHGRFFNGGPGFDGPMMGGYDGFAGHMGAGHYGAALFGSHIGGFVVLVAVGIAIWFFATGRHLRPQLATATAPAPVSAPAPATAPAPSATPDPAEEIARQRFASGEIDAEQYGAILATLRNRA